MPTPPPLGPREAQVLAYAVLGHSNKLIAYELGLSSATVSQALSRAAHKLGVRTRGEAVGFVLQMLTAQMATKAR